MSGPAFVSIWNPSLSPFILWQGAVQGQPLRYPFHYNSVPWKPFWLWRSVTVRSKQTIFSFNNFCDLCCCWRTCESHVGELWPGFRMLLRKRWPSERAAAARALLARSWPHGPCRLPAGAGMGVELMCLCWWKYSCKGIVVKCVIFLSLVANLIPIC